MIVQELECRAEPPVIDKLYDAVEFFQLVLQRRSCQHDGVPAAQPLDGPACFRHPVLDALRLVQHDQIRLPGVEFIQVADGDFVVDESVKRRLAIWLRRSGVLPSITWTFGRCTSNFRLPLIFHRRRRHHQHALDAALTGQQFHAASVCSVLPRPMSSPRMQRPRQARTWRRDPIRLERDLEQVEQHAVRSVRARAVPAICAGARPSLGVRSRVHELHRVGEDRHLLRHLYDLDEF